MKATQILAEDVLVDKAIDAVMKSLGPLETTRFFALCTPKRTDSVQRHRTWQRRLNKTAFLNKVLSAPKARNS